MADDEIEKLSASDKRKLEQLKDDYERDGPIAFKRLRDKDFMAYARIIGAHFPGEWKEALEEALLDAGLTIADIRRMAKKAQWKQ